MVTNEVFIDSVTLRENVVSLVRNVGYLPRSRKAAKANISFSVDAKYHNVTTVTLKVGIIGVSNRQVSNVFQEEHSRFQMTSQFQ